MRKHFTVWLIALIGLMGMSGASLQAQATSGTAGSLTWKYDTGTKTLTISGQGDMPNYTWEHRAPWEEHLKTVKLVVFEDGVTGIGDYAFFEAVKLDSVKLPNTLKRIGGWAFETCYNLRLTRLPDKVQEIGQSAFNACSKVALPTLPSDLQKIGNGAFLWCGGMASVTIPAGVTEIGRGAFANCENLTAINVAAENAHYISEDGILFNKEKTELVQYPAGRSGTSYPIPSEVKSIGNDAFNGANQLTSMSIQQGVERIGEWAFANCKSLTEATISSTVKTIGEQAFIGCNALTKIQVDGANTAYTSIDGVLFSKNKAELIKYPENRSGNTYKIPSDVTVIKYGAFSTCKKLTSVEIPNNVREIEMHAFSSSGLTSLTIPTGVTKMNFFAFGECEELASVTLPAGITEIENHVFLGCKKLKNVTARMQTPPNIEHKNIFRDVTLSDVTLTVPKGTTEAYKAAGWTGFKEYKEAASTFDVQPTNLTIGYMPFTKTIEVACDKDWTASIEGADWIKITDDSDPQNIKGVSVLKGRGNRTFQLRGYLNNDSLDIKAKVVIETKDDANNPIKKEVQVTQKGWYGIEIDGIGLTPENFSNTNKIDASSGFSLVKSGTVTYIPKTNTIILENAEIKSENNAVALGWARKGTLVLKRKNKVETANLSIMQNIPETLHITGDGSLDVSSSAMYGTISSLGNLVIDGGCSIDANAPITSFKKMTIDGAQVHAINQRDALGALQAWEDFELKGGVSVQPKDAESKPYVFMNAGYTNKYYTFKQGDAFCNDVRIGREVKLEAKAVKEEPVSIDGGEAKINVTSDAKWKVTVPAEAAAWVEVKGKTAGTNPNDSLVTLTVKPNLAQGTPREATLLFETVAEKGLPAKQEVKITQEGSNFLAHWVSIYDTTLHFTAKKDTLKMKITSNTDWEISVPNSGEWLRIEKNGAANGDFKFEGKLAAKDTVIKLIAIANNDEYTSRNAKITFKTKDGRFTQELIAVQDGKFRIKLPAKKTLDLDHVPANKETVQTFEIRSEEPWTLDISALTNLRTKYLFNGLPWLTVETSPLTGGGAHDSIVKVTIAANTAVAARGAKLEFMNASGTSMGKFNLKQDAATPAPTPSTPSTPSNQGTTRPTTPVIVSITRITLDKTEIVVDGNAKSLWLTTIISPTNATNKVIKWTSSDSAVASVSDRGLVTIHKKGKAVITATTTDGSGKSATCSILVRSTVSNALLPEARIYTADGRLYLTLPNAASVRIYNLNGTLVRTFNAPAGETSLALPQGVYVVKAGAKTEKVVVQ